MSEFMVWKEAEEAENYLYFSKQTSSRESSNYTYSYFVCQHDGDKKVHNKKGEPERKTDKKYKHGQIKTGLFCPARIIAKFDKSDNTVNVSYTRIHSHLIKPSDTIYQPLPKSLRSEIKTKLSLGVPVTTIYRDVREGKDERVKRGSADEKLTKRHLLKKSNITDIRRHMNYDKRLHQDDDISTYLLIKQLQEEGLDTVLVYKPQGGDVLIGPSVYNQLDLKKDLFVLGIQTQQQREMFTADQWFVTSSTDSEYFKLSFTNLIKFARIRRGEKVIK